VVLPGTLGSASCMPLLLAERAKVLWRPHNSASAFLNWLPWPPSWHCKVFTACGEGTSHQLRSSGLLWALLGSIKAEFHQVQGGGLGRVWSIPGPPHYIHSWPLLGLVSEYLFVILDPRCSQGGMGVLWGTEEVRSRAPGLGPDSRDRYLMAVW
jgi:hypothetical protein